jgi:hypothetical protein
VAGWPKPDTRCCRSTRSWCAAAGARQARKDEAEHARICCLLALDRHAGLRRLIPHGQLAGELRSIARDDERACRDERRLLNRLRADLLVTVPAALAIACEDLGATRILRLLERWPAAAALAAASREEIIEFGRAPRRLVMLSSSRVAPCTASATRAFSPPGLCSSTRRAVRRACSWRAAASRSPVSRCSPGDLSVLTSASDCWPGMTPACRRSSRPAHGARPDTGSPDRPGSGRFRSCAPPSTHGATPSSAESLLLLYSSAEATGHVAGIIGGMRVLIPG